MKNRRGLTAQVDASLTPAARLEVERREKVVVTVDADLLVASADTLYEDHASTYRLAHDGKVFLTVYGGEKSMSELSIAVIYAINDLDWQPVSNHDEYGTIYLRTNRTPLNADEAQAIARHKAEHGLTQKLNSTDPLFICALPAAGSGTLLNVRAFTSDNQFEDISPTICFLLGWQYNSVIPSIIMNGDPDDAIKRLAHDLWHALWVSETTEGFRVIPVSNRPLGPADRLLARLEDGDSLMVDADDESGYTTTLVSVYRMNGDDITGDVADALGWQKTRGPKNTLPFMYVEKPAHDFLSSTLIADALLEKVGLTLKIKSI